MVLLLLLALCFYLYLLNYFNMSAFLIQNTASTVVLFLADRYLGTGKEHLTSTDVLVSLKKPADPIFVAKTLIPTVNATATIGGGANGSVLVGVPGTYGNLFTVEVEVPVGTSPLSATVVGNVITVSLSVTGGIANNSENTAILVATALENASELVTASYSGTGADPLTVASGPTALVGGTDGSLIDIGGGYYKLALLAADTSALGALYIRVDGPDINSIVDVANVGAVTPVVPPTIPTIPTTVIFGTLLDPAGDPVENACVSAKILATPAIFDGVVISSSLTTVRTDASGYFTLTLITGAQVDVFIPSANYRRTITVPATSTSLFDIP